MNKDDMIMLEKKMWEAAKNRNREEFLDVVSEEMENALYCEILV